MQKRLTIKNVFTEDAVLKWLDLEPPQLATLRNRQKFPYIQVNREVRLYLENDIIEWLLTKRQNLASEGE